MLELSSNVGPLRHRTKWFAGQLSWMDGLGLVSYVQSAPQGSRLGFVRRSFQTKVIDLTASEEEIFRQFPKSTRYKISRARREGVTCHFDGDPGAFRRFYNQIASRHGRWPILPGRIEGAGAAACVS